MATKLTANRAVVIRSLSSSVEQNGAAVAEPLEMLLFPDGVPENLTVAMVIEALGKAPLRLYSNLATADIDLTKELSDDQPYRDQRDEGVAKLRVDWQRTQGAILSGWGRGALVQVGLAGEMPSDPDQLAQKALAAADLIETADLGDPEIPVDRPAVAAYLRASATHVSTSLDHVSREKREEQAARLKRDEADDVLRRVYAGFADAFAGLASAIGLVDVAQRVRPTARRRAGLPEEEDVVVADPAVVTDPNDSEA